MNLADLLKFGLGQRAVPAHRTFTLRKQRIHYEFFCEAIRKIARVHERGIESGTFEGLLIVAQSGGGKTALTEYYAAQFPRTMDDNGQVIPVLVVATPENPTVKTFAQAILVALGDPAFDRGTAEAKTQRLIVLLKQCRISLLIIDEFQHFADGRSSEARRITDWLKNLLNAVRVPVVLFGLPRSIAVLRLNPQLRRRFSAPHYLRPFGLEKKEFEQLRGVLKTFHSALPIPCVSLNEVEMARRFFFATNGLIDAIVKLIDAAVSAYDVGSKEPLGLKHFAQAFRSEIWGEAPDQLNPFCDGASLRRLMAPREPYDNWDDPRRYTDKPRSYKKGGKK